MVRPLMPPPASRLDRRPDRRLMPRPLPAHLASAMLLWLSSRAALTSWPNGWPLSKAEGDRFAAVRAEVERLGADSTLAALDRELSRRADGFAAGLAAYHSHPFRRTRAQARVVWRRGAVRLLDYGRGGGSVMLVVPSLINRY